ncbi:MAG TPA: hypothetical protein VGF75_05585 [Candidatus Saccharimonadales bacterium]|jgi:hypothetical protein
MPSTPINPSTSNINSFPNVLRWAQSVYKTIVRGISFALGNGSDSTGVYNTFDITNGDGIMVRVGASGGAEPIQWDGSSQADIALLLNRKPTGWIVCDIDKSATIWRVGAPTPTLLTLQTSDVTCSITVWIF